MSEFEDGLRDAMREELREADEDFVSKVGAGMDRQDAWRIVGLSLAAAAAVVLVAMLAVASGPALAELLRLPLGTPTHVTPFIWTAAPVAAVLLAGAVAVPLMRRRR